MPRSTRTMKDVQHAVGERVKDLPMRAARLTVTGIGHLLLLSDRIRKEARQARETGVGDSLVRLRDDAGRLVGRVADRVTGGPPRIPPRSGAGARPDAGAAEPAAKTAPTPEAVEIEEPTAEAAPETKPAAPPEPMPEPMPEPTTAMAPSAAARSDETTAAKAAKQAETKPAEPVEPAKAARPAETKSAKPAEAKRTKPAETEPAKPAEAEPAPRKVAPRAADLPIPDYDERTIPSLRSRLRGLSAHQVSQLRDYEQTHANRGEVVRMYENRIAKLTGGQGG